MIRFTIQLFKSTFKECRGQIIMVCFGMIMCLLLLIQTADSLFSYENNFYGDISDQKAYEYNHNLWVYFYPDTDKLEQIVEMLSDISGIQGVFMESQLSTGEKIQCGTQMPLIETDDVVTMNLPGKLENGEIITSCNELLNCGMENVYITHGQSYEIAGIQFTNVAQTGSSSGHILTVHDFLELYDKTGSGDIVLSYVYRKGFTKEQQQQAEEQMDIIRTAGHKQQGIAQDRIEFSLFLQTSQILILGIVIASLNAFYIYIVYLKKRIKIYSILKLQGISNGSLRAMLYLELLLIYLSSCLISFVVYMGKKLCQGSMFYHTWEIFLYVYVLIWIVFTLVFLVGTIKLIKRQPFELYRQG